MSIVKHEVSERESEIANTLNQKRVNAYLDIYKETDFSGLGILIDEELNVYKYINSVLNKMNGNDNLIIIINNEKQREKKYRDKVNPNILPKIIGFGTTTKLVNKLQEFYPYSNVRVMISKSDDQTVCCDLEKLSWFFARRKHVIFVKDGGEYNMKNLPERKVKGIDFLFLQNPKIASATEILLRNI